MKLQPDQMDTLAVTGYDSGWIAVNGVRHTSSLLLSAQGLLRPWEKSHFDNSTPRIWSNCSPSKAKALSSSCWARAQSCGFYPPRGSKPCTRSAWGWSAWTRQRRVERTTFWQAKAARSPLLCCCKSEGRARACFTRERSPRPVHLAPSCEANAATPCALATPLVGSGLAH